MGGEGRGIVVLLLSVSDRCVNTWCLLTVCHVPCAIILPLVLVYAVVPHARGQLLSCLHLCVPCCDRSTSTAVAGRPGRRRRGLA